ncbi:hypothetical protein SAMN05444336_102607 [Albimonas donghaensis]|uniref:Ammonia monooxygenase n=2 Tax=Albimonas donghaensis TaxID=356660 RepID=A0A1H2X4W4_9RHOB|nr:hypothetical protein SAMN05444336_102607 [Albimonas donghaensis]
MQWAALTVLSLIVAGLMEWAHLPAALLLGPMAAAIAVAVNGARAQAPDAAFLLAQGVIGCMVGANIPAGTLAGLGTDWPIFLLGVGSVICVSAGLGWVLARAQVLPGTTAVWGAFPGAASAMVLMSASYGADMRLVAVMQYLRVGMVAGSAALVTRLWVGAPEGEAAATDWFPALDLPGLGVTAGVIAVSLAATRAFRVPSGAFLLPLLITATLENSGTAEIATPPWLLAAAFAVTGWAVGLRFNRLILRHAARALPRLVLAIAGLLVLCGAFAMALAELAGIDPLTAFLATSPGGADSVAIIAASADVDVPFVMAMQTARFLAVLATGPFIARFIAARIPRAHAPGE